MHWKTAIIILVVTVIYAVIGGVIFHFVEFGNERYMKEAAYQRLQMFLAERPCLNLSTIRAMSDLLKRAKSAGLQAIPGASNLTYITNWDLTSSIFMAFQVMSSVGYGNSPPVTLGGRIFCFIFAFFGILLLLLSGLGIGYLMLSGAERLRKICIRNAGPKDAVKVNILRIVIIFVLLFILFILIPAAILTVMERKWNYGEAIYFCLTSVITIGFGDFVPGSDWETNLRNLYRLGVGFWLIISLLAFQGLWSSISIEIGSTGEMQEPLPEQGDGSPLPGIFPPLTFGKKIRDSSIAYVPPEAKMSKMFADARPVTFRNSNPYTFNNSPLYNVAVPQGEVTQVHVR